jgi:hypothetical protein
MTNSNTQKIGPDRWSATLIDVGDGSGDSILELPPEMVNQWGLKEGDVIELNKGNNGEILIAKKIA